WPGRCGGVRRISGEPVEVLRARRRLRAELALRGFRQRAGRGDGVRHTGGRDRVRGHTRDRGRRTQRYPRRPSRAGGAGRRARVGADRRVTTRAAERRGEAVGATVRRPCRRRRLRSRARGGAGVTTATDRLMPQTWRLVVAGIAIGVVYVLSPLTVWFA